MNPEVLFKAHTWDLCVRVVAALKVRNINKKKKKKDGEKKPSRELRLHHCDVVDDVRVVLSLVDPFNGDVLGSLVVASVQDASRTRIRR